MKTLLWRLIPLFIFISLGIFLGRGLYLEPQKLPSSQLGQPLPLFNLPVLGKKQQGFTPVLLQGKTVLINVWASWCPACVDEQAFLLQLAGQGVPIYGLNYKDSSAQALHWLREWGNPYKLVGEDKLGKTAIDLGVYGAPETFLVDARGIIRFRHAGVLDEKSWTRDFLPRIRELERKA